MKTKAFILAATMLTAASANAAWDTGATFETGNGEFLLSAWDSDRQLSFSQDLGVRFNDAGVSQVVNVDAALSVFGGDFSGVSWNVGAASNYNANFADLSGYGVIISGAAPAMPVLGFSDFGNAFNKFNTFAATTGANQGLAADNDSFTATSNTDVTWSGDPAWGDNMNAGVPSGTVGSNGDLLNLHFLGLNGSFAGTSSVAGSVSFDMNAGTVSFNSASPVPVPAAAWLLISGLTGLGAVARRRKA